MHFDEGHLRKVLLERLEADLVVRRPHTRLGFQACIFKRQGLAYGLR
jgi:hypothetical protein